MNDEENKGKEDREKELKKKYNFESTITLYCKFPQISIKKIIRLFKILGLIVFLSLIIILVSVGVFTL